MTPSSARTFLSELMAAVAVELGYRWEPLPMSHYWVNAIKGTIVGAGTTVQLDLVDATTTVVVTTLNDQQDFGHTVLLDLADPDSTDRLKELIRGAIVTSN